jgi:DNA repair protein RecN (Recombination protein N)
MVLVQECADGMRGYTEGLEIDPGQLRQLEERMSVVHDLARKHHCRPNELPELHEQLRRELDSLEHADRDLAELQSRLDTQASDYRKTAQQLSASRLKTAHTFGKRVSKDMHQLGMPGGVFEALVTHEADRPFSPQGMDSIEFMVSANPGQPPGPLSKVASGGELSRISLAIQVICMKGEHIPTLIFDEVDTGIGGGVAEIVGQKLRDLGKDRQVFCVTHLPQVAALASCHLQVSKLTGENTTRTRVHQLGSEERVDELARMLGGVKITRHTRKHAQEVLARSQNPEGKARKHAKQ